MTSTNAKISRTTKSSIKNLETSNPFAENVYEMNYNETHHAMFTIEKTHLLALIKQATISKQRGENWKGRTLSFNQTIVQKSRIITD